MLKFVTLYTVNMTSSANKMSIFLWQIAAVIPIFGHKSSVDVPGYETKPLTIMIVGGNDFGIMPQNVMVWF